MSTLMVTVGGIEYPIAPLSPPESDHPDSGYYAITPEVARAWLAFNYRNRNLRKRELSSYARDIKSGDHDVNGETIKISRPLKDGEDPEIPAGHSVVLDGQHRMRAVIKSGKPIVTLVAYGLDPSVSHTIDSGVRRIQADVFRMSGEKHSAVLASLVRRAWAYEEQNERRFAGNYSPTKKEADEFLNKYGDRLRRAAEIGVWVRQDFKFPPQSVVALAHFVLNGLNEEEAPWFFSHVRDGAEMERNHPIMALRRRFMEDRSNRVAPLVHQQLSYFFRAWNGYLENRAMSRIVQAPTDPMPVPRAERKVPRSQPLGDETQGDNGSANES
jgi:hypothetical protein